MSADGPGPVNCIIKFNSPALDHMILTTYMVTDHGQFQQQSEYAKVIYNEFLTFEAIFIAIGHCCFPP